MKKIGDMYSGRSGIYLIHKLGIHFSWYKYAIYHTFDDLELSGLKKMKHFYFKKEALDFIQHEEYKYLRSEPYLESQVDSGLLSKEEMLKRLKGERYEEN